MSNVIIDLKNIDITFTQKRRTIQAVKDVSIQSFASAYRW